MKANQFDGYKEAVERDRMEQDPQKKMSSLRLKWDTVKTNDSTKINPIFDSTDHVMVSGIRQKDSSVSSRIVSHKLGYKINLSEQKDNLIDKYIKSFIQSKSHNYIVSRFAQFKSSFLAQLLSLLGVTIPELQKLQKKALKSTKDENELLFEENEYNAELICIIGGSSKKLKKELQIMDEIRTQLITQMTNIGKGDYYSENHVLFIKIKVCKRILEELKREVDFLQYQRDYYYLNKDGVQHRKLTNSTKKLDKAL
ncbi:MAG: hypothetical protein AABZ14_06455 [Candidatus Margulisiibacteriota bacterium]